MFGIQITDYSKEHKHQMRNRIRSWKRRAASDELE
jgi:hypothetical protein